jgi:hypothetical protein
LEERDTGLRLDLAEFRGWTRNELDYGRRAQDAAEARLRIELRHHAESIQRDVANTRSELIRWLWVICAGQALAAGAILAAMLVLH